MITNFALQAERLFTLAGLGFGSEESNMIYLALKRLASS